MKRPSSEARQSNVSKNQATKREKRAIHELKLAKDGWPRVDASQYFEAADSGTEDQIASRVHLECVRGAKSPIAALSLAISNRIDRKVYRVSKRFPKLSGAGPDSRLRHAFALGSSLAKAETHAEFVEGMEILSAVVDGYMGRLDWELLGGSYRSDRVLISSEILREVFATHVRHLRSFGEGGDPLTDLTLDRLARAVGGGSFRSHSDYDKRYAYLKCEQIVLHERALLTRGARAKEKSSDRRWKQIANEQLLRDSVLRELRCSFPTEFTLSREMEVRDRLLPTFKRLLGINGRAIGVPKALAAIFDEFRSFGFNPALSENRDSGESNPTLEAISKVLKEVKRASSRG